MSQETCQLLVQEEIPDHEVLVVLSDDVCIVRRQLQLDLFAYNDSVRISLLIFYPIIFYENKNHTGGERV